jgi:hypothetical protein
MSSLVQELNHSNYINQPVMSLEYRLRIACLRNYMKE